MSDDYISQSDSDLHLVYYLVSSSPMTHYPDSDARSSPRHTEQRAQASKPRSEPYPVQPTIPTRPIVKRLGYQEEHGLCLFTAQHPSVVQCLDYVRMHWHIPPNMPEPILALMAVETFIHPFDPVHWIFWSNEKKDQTAKLVQRHLRGRYPTIYSFSSWEAHDWKFRLSGMHCKDLPNVLCQKPWYNTLAYPTFRKDVPAKGPVLRKRKAAQPAVDLLATSEQAEEEVQAPAKRARTTRAKHTPRAALATESLLESTGPSIEQAYKTTPDTTIPAPESSLLLGPSDSLSTSQPAAPSGRSSSRVPRKTLKALAGLSSQTTRASVSPSTSALSSPSSSSVLLPPPEFPRTRSSSRLSARTLVDESRSSSPSVSSATTVAESSTSPPGQTKGAQKVVDDGDTGVVAVIDIVVEDASSTLALEGDNEEEESRIPRATRSRRGPRTGASSTGPAVGPQRSQMGRKGRANSVAPYTIDKSARGEVVAVAASAAENSATPEAVVSTRKSRKAKNSRK